MCYITYPGASPSFSRVIAVKAKWQRVTQMNANTTAAAAAAARVR